MTPIASTSPLWKVARDVQAITIPREFHLPKFLQNEPPFQPEDTDLYIWTWEDVGPQGKEALYGICFMGKSNKPLWNYRFVNDSDRTRRINETVESRRRQLREKEKARQERKDFVHGLQPGDIFVSSWGYDQTNVNFYQVTEVRGKDVVVREVGQDVVSSGSGSDRVVPIPNRFIEPPVRVRPSGGSTSVSFKVDGHYCRKWDGKPQHQTSSGWGH
jgi:hypothetical protein